MEGIGHSSVLKEEYALEPSWPREWPAYDKTRTPGRRLRGLIRVALAGIYLWVIYLLFYIGLLFAGRSAARRTAVQQWTIRTWSRGCLLLMGARVEIQGNPPKPPYFLVCNHLSHVDIFLLGTVVHARFVAKKEVALWPAIGRMAASTGALFIHRENRRDLLRINELMAGAMDEGRGVALFIEGTSSRGKGLLPFKPSLLELPAQRDFPVYYATVTYSTPPGELPADLFVCWWGGMPFAPHFLRMVEMKGFTARLTFAPAPIRADNRKELTAKLREAMTTQFEPVAGAGDD